MAHKNKQTLSSEQDGENDNVKDMHFEFDNLWIFKLCSFLLNGISKSSCDYGTLYKMSQAWISNICKLTSQYLNKIEKRNPLNNWHRDRDEDGYLDRFYSSKF